MKLNPSHPALTSARTIYPGSIRNPKDNKTPILKSVSDNNKVGKGSNIITKGKWRGMPMFSLTLEERATCPSDCNHWDDCYGNGMGLAHRFQHGKELEKRLFREISELARKYTLGFVIRLHILGDFYSVRYVQLWRDMLEMFPNLRVFGYTARSRGNIAKALKHIRGQFPERWWIRASRNNPNILLSAYSIPSPISVHCPEQTGKTESCLSCGFCWSAEIPVYFQAHDELNKLEKEMSCGL